jgi:flagellar L-ring protein precursor FlgH
MCPMSRRHLLIAMVAVPLAGCGQLQRVAEIGRPPAMSPSSDPTADPNWRPMSMPMPHPEGETPPPNSLWRPGSRAFFKDQRASRVGDLITVLVNISDSAALQTKSSSGTTGSESMGVPNFLGLEALAPKMISSALNVQNLVNANSTGSFAGNGAIARNETVTLSLAGEVTQVLPNGNLVVSASQEVRVNGELRQLKVSGVIRPEDIASDNTISHERMAEARIDYGGRGQISDYQQPRVGQQLLDAILPF